MTDILIGQTVDVGDTPASQWTQNETSQLNITQTAASTPGSPVVALQWTAPKTGAVELVIGGGFRDNAGNGRVFAFPETFEGVGAGGPTVITDTDIYEYGLQTPDEATNFCYFSRRSLLTGLTWGAEYYTRFAFWADNSGSADLTVRDLAVIPSGPAHGSARIVRATPPVQFAADETSQLNLTSLTAQPGDPDVSVFFTAPRTGRVLLTVGGGLRDNASTNRVYLAPAVYETNDQGAVLFAGDTVVQRGFGCPPDATEYWYGSRHTVLSGLTAGRVYFARLNQFVDGGSTCDINRRELLVEPIP